MVGHHLAVAPNHDPVGVGADLHRPPRRLGRHRVAVAVELDQTGGLRSVLRARPISRAIVFTPLPRAKCSRRIFATVSNTNTPVSIRSSTSRRSGHQSLKDRGAILDADIPAGRRRLSRKQSDGWQKSRQAPMSFGRHTPPTRRFQGIAVPGRRHGYGEPAYSNFDVIGANDLVPALAPRCGCAWQTRRMCFEPPTALARLTNTGDAAKAVVRRGPGPNQKSGGRCDNRSLKSHNHGR